jgi:hypothetical protein
MLRVTIELVPFGDERYAKPIAELFIANTGGGNNEVANYEMVGCHKNPDSGGEILSSKVYNFSRDAGAVQLLGQILKRMKTGEPEIRTKLTDNLRKRVKMLR